MIAVRWTYLPKKKKVQEFVDLWKEKAQGIERTIRIYRPNSSPWGQVVIEVEFESLTEYAVWFESRIPENFAFIEKLEKLRKAGGSGEIWILE